MLVVKGVLAVKLLGHALCLWLGSVHCVCVRARLCVWCSVVGGGLWWVECGVCGVRFVCVCAFCVLCAWYVWSLCAPHPSSVGCNATHTHTLTVSGHVASQPTLAFAVANSGSSYEERSLGETTPTSTHRDITNSDNTNMSTTHTNADSKDTKCVCV